MSIKELLTINIGDKYEQILTLGFRTTKCPLFILLLKFA